MGKIETLKPKQIVIAGIEAHVCVLQTTIGLLDIGYQCFVAGDATSSRLAANHAAGMARLREAGAGDRDVGNGRIRVAGEGRYTGIQGTEQVVEMTGKPKLVLVPGLLCSDTLWTAQTEGLADIADIIVADITRDDTMDGMAQRILDGVNGSFSLAGLSMGGIRRVRSDAAARRVDRLALLDTGARADTLEQTTRRRDLIELADQGEFKAVSPKLLPLLIHLDRLSDAALVAEISAMADSVGKDAFLRQQNAIMRRADSRPGLSAIECSTLVVCGRKTCLRRLTSAWK